MLKRIRNLWRISQVEIAPEPKKTFVERYKAKLQKPKATIIDLNEQPVFDLKRESL